MNDTSDIERWLQSLQWEVPSAIEGRLLDDAGAALGEHRAQRLRRWRLAQRAAIVLLLLGSAVLLLVPFARPPLTLAQVRQAMVAQRWVHIKYDNGREQWTNLVTGQVFFRDYDGRAVYTESNGLRLWYWPNTTYIGKDRWYTGDVAPARSLPTTAWDQFVSFLEVETTQPTINFDNPLVKRVADRLNDRAVVRFDCYTRDGLGNRLLTEQVWADTESHLPVQDRQVLQAGEREGQHRDAIVGRYDFPTTGPTSIYELGVSRTYPIVDTDAPPTADLAGVLAAAKAAQTRFPTRFRRVTWEEGQAVDVTIRSGRKQHFQRYFTYSPPLPPWKAPFEPNPTAILKWCAGRVPIEDVIADGHVEFSRTNPQPDIPGQPARPQVHVMAYLAREIPEDEAPLMFYTDDGSPPADLWEYLNSAGSWQLVLPGAEVPAGLLVLRNTLGETRTEYWIDPAKDYIGVQVTDLKLVGSIWKKKSVTTLGDLTRLSTGAWFPSRSTTDYYGVGDVPADSVTATRVLHFWLTPLSPTDIPAGTFDGKPLLKGADVTTY